MDAHDDQKDLQYIGCCPVFGEGSAQLEIATHLRFPAKHVQAWGAAL